MSLSITTFSLAEFVAGFSSYPAGLASYLPAFCFTNVLGFQLSFSLYPFETLLFADFGDLTVFPGIPLPPGLELRFAGGSGVGACCVSLCVLPPSLFPPLCCRGVASSLTQWPQLTTKSTADGSGFSRGQRLWQGAGIALDLPTWPGLLPSPSLGRQLPAGGRPGHGHCFPSVSFHG